MYNRRQFLKGSALLLGLGGTTLGVPAPTRDELPDGAQAKGMIDDDSEKAIQRGLKYLAAQQRAEGFWGTGQYSGNVAVTSLGALAFMAGGHLPGRGLYGEQVTRALRYVLNQESPNVPGYLAKSDHTHGPMYGHGFGTLFLGEVYGMVNDRGLRDEVGRVLRRAVKVIVQGQST